MDDSPLVSVIIIFFNTEAFIEEAIESVIDQTYTSWEVLLIDDGSTDIGTQIAQRYVAQYPKQIHYFEHPNHENRGMSASRNLGLRHARGEHIAFLDADDVWLPHKLERQVAILASQPEAAMVYGKTEYWYSWTRNPEDSSRDYVQYHGIEVNTLYKPPVLLSLFLRGKAAVPCTCSILVRREALERMGGFEESFQGMYEDQAFYAKVCLTEPIFVSDEYLDRYRQHPDSNCSVAAKTGYSQSARLHFLNWLTTYISELRAEDRELWQALQRELWRIHDPIWLPPIARVQYLMRWTKKWLLRVEERTLPASVRHRIWTR